MKVYVVFVLGENDFVDGYVEGVYSSFENAVLARKSKLDLVDDNEDTDVFKLQIYELDSDEKPVTTYWKYSDLLRDYVLDTNTKYSDLSY